MKAGYAVSNNLLIVESHNDKFFIERLKREIAAPDFNIDTPICNIDDYECLGGMNNLEKKLKEICSDIKKRGLDKIGILLDADNEGIAARVALINQAVKSIDSALSISSVNKWYESTFLQIQISCHILNVNGTGELETLLKTIKSKRSTYADCLSGWKACLASQEITINDKDFDKFWVSLYQRYDCCTDQEQKQAGRKCNPETSLIEKDMWDFSHEALNDLKSYLMMFN
jgi:hypothetical protein